MHQAPLPSNEEERLNKLQSLGILDTPPEEIFDDLTELAAYICGTPVSLVSLIDKERQWFKSRYNWNREFTERSKSFCQYTILFDDIFEVEDAEAESIFHGSPLVRDEPGIRFYAGAPLLSSDGFALGSICVLDFKPNKLDQQQRKALRTLSRQVSFLIEMRKLAKDLGLDYSSRQRHQKEDQSYQELTSREIVKLLDTLQKSGSDVKKAQGLARDLLDHNIINREGVQGNKKPFNLIKSLRNNIEVENQSTNKDFPTILLLDQIIPEVLEGDEDHLKRITELLFDTVNYSGEQPVKFSAEVQWKSRKALKVRFTLSEPHGDRPAGQSKVAKRIKRELINRILSYYQDSLHTEEVKGYWHHSFEMEFELPQ